MLGFGHMPLRVITVHRAHAVSGVSVAGARLCAQRATRHRWAPLIIGAEVTRAELVSTPFAGMSAHIATWTKGAPIPEQVLIVRDALRELGAEVVVPHDLAVAFVAAAMERERGVRTAFIAHGDDLTMHDYYERCVPLADAW
jgi:hypothetical protein